MLSVCERFLGLELRQFIQVCGFLQKGLTDLAKLIMSDIIIVQRNAIVELVARLIRFSL